MKRNNLRRIIYSHLLVFCIAALSSKISISADIKKGIEAYKQGDYATALEEWLPIAEHGNADAQFSVGLLFDQGLNVVPDYKTAVEWFTLASKQGHVFAQSNLGWKYHKGQGVAKDNVQAFKWWSIAASKGHENTPYFLSVVSESMTPSEIMLAKSLVIKCIESNLEDCI